MNIILADTRYDLLQAWRNVADDKKYVTLHHGSIFQVTCDALVSPANSFGFMDGGLDLAISQFFGRHVQQRVQELIKTRHYGELLVGQAEIVPTDHPQIPYLISAPTMRTPMVVKETKNAYLSVKALLILVKFGKFDDGTPIADRVKRIALPGMGTGVGKITPEMFALQMKRACEEIIEEKYSFPKSWWEVA